MFARRFFAPATLSDDRGRDVRLWSYRDALRSEDPVQRSIATRAAYIEAAEFRRFGIVMGVGLAIGGLAGIAIGIAPIRFFAVVALAFVLLQLQLRRRIGRKIAPGVRLTLLSEGCCASCAYDLAGLPPEEDGRTVCPECRAAWLIEPEMIEARHARERLTPPKAPDPESTASDLRNRDSFRHGLAFLGWRRSFAARDARGRMVELVNPGPFAPRPPLWKSIPPAERRRLWRRLYAVGWPLRALIAIVSIPTMAFTGWMYLLRVGPAAMPYRPLSVTLGVFQGIVLPLVFLGIVVNPMTRSGKPLIRIMLRAGRCPSCAGPLAPSPAPSVTPSDANVCPSCRAAWNEPAAP